MRFCSFIAIVTKLLATIHAHGNHIQTYRLLYTYTVNRSDLVPSYQQLSLNSSTEHNNVAKSASEESWKVMYRSYLITSGSLLISRTLNDLETAKTFQLENPKHCIEILHWQRKLQGFYIKFCCSLTGDIWDIYLQTIKNLSKKI